MTPHRRPHREGLPVGGSASRRPRQAAAGFAIALAGPVVWVSSHATNTLVRISANADAPRPPATTAATAERTRPPRRRCRPAVRSWPRVDVPAGPGGLAVGAGGVWSGDDGGGTLTRIDPQTNAIVAKIDIPAGAGEAAAGEGAVWVANTAAGTVSRIDPRPGEGGEDDPRRPAARRRRGRLGRRLGRQRRRPLRLPHRSRDEPGREDDPRSARLEPAARSTSASSPATASSGPRSPTSPPSSRSTRRTTPSSAPSRFPAPPCGFLALDARQVWSAGGACADLVTRVDARTTGVAPVTVAEPHPIGLALLAGSLWVAALGSKTVDRLDPSTGRVARAPRRRRHADPPGRRRSDRSGCATTTAACSGSGRPASGQGSPRGIAHLRVIPDAPGRRAGSIEASGFRTPRTVIGEMMHGHVHSGVR